MSITVNKTKKVKNLQYGNKNIILGYKGDKLVWCKFSDAASYICREIDGNGYISLPSGTLPSASDIKILDDYCLNYAFYRASGLTGTVSFPNMKVIVKEHTLQESFSRCTGITSASFPVLKTIKADYGISQTFRFCSNLTSATFPELVEITGSYSFHYAFASSGLTSITFPKLSVIGKYTQFNNTFGDCTKLTSVSFPKLTTTTIDNLQLKNVFYSMFNSSTGSNVSKTTVYFPSNLKSKIQALDGYPTFGGNSDKIAISFSLTATS